jgi:hypothetical protein
LTFKGQIAVIALAVLVAGRCLAQDTPANSPSISSSTSSNPWTLSLTTSGYIIPGGESYVSPDFSADRGKLHLEARYNDEAMRTASLWVGYNYTVGKKLVLNLTPMAGAVFGNLNGVAPGCNITLTRNKFQVYASAEEVLSFQSRSNNYFYIWDQATYSPVKWLQVGLVSQRTRTYTTALSVQRGVLVGLTHKKLNLTTSIFNFGWTTPTEVLALGITF